MSEKTSPSLLEQARREIDALDDQLLALLQARFAVTERVRQAKAQNGAMQGSPLRPKREAEILARLVGHAQGLNANLIVRIWRGIFSFSSARQSTVTLHVSKAVATDVDLRLALQEHYGAFALQVHDDDAAARLACEKASSDLCALASWPADIRAELVAVLADRRLFVFGHLPLGEAIDFDVENVK